MGRQSQRQTKLEKRMAMWNKPLKQALKRDDDERDPDRRDVWTKDLQMVLFPPTPTGDDRYKKPGAK
jgi:hypothetical protein